MILLSQCLAGAHCRWDGGTNLVPELRALVESGLAVTVCPEVSGGLPTPRNPSEILDGRVITSYGEDVTDCFHTGAETALRVFEEYHCDYAVLKARSPSCGCGMVYNGKFDGGLVPGNGITAQLLLEHGYHVMTEEEWQKKHPSKK